MAKLSADKKSVTVERGDTLSAIARTYGNGLSYKQLASINGISNPNLIRIGQVIKLSGKATSTGSSGSTANSNTVTINQFGLQSNAENTLFITWQWSKSNTDKYEVEWYYDSGDSVWFVGTKTTTTDKQSLYNIPSNAKQVRVRIKPVSKQYSKNNKQTFYWTANWSSYKTHKTSDNPPKTPSSSPSVKIEKYKLTVEMDGLEELNATGIQFQIVKDDTSVFNTGKAEISTGHASYSCTVDAGHKYKVRCRSYKGNDYSDWTTYSGNTNTIPSAIDGITTIKANSETSVYLAWNEVKTAETYDIEYTTKLAYFDGTNQTTTTSGIETTHYELIGLETGQEYFFRVRATNREGSSAWSEIKSVLVGKEPAAPTTWSSTTTSIVGEPLNLYWVHNSVDGSSQTYAELELIIDGIKETYTIKNSEDEDEKDKTSVYKIDTTLYKEGTKVEWRVRTSGVTKAYGDWSVQRLIDIYAPPTLALNVTDLSGNEMETLTSFPFYIHALAGPNTQAPIGYHVVITSNDAYETVDSIGNVKMVNSGEEIYSKHFDINETLLLEMTASSIDLENNVSYTVKCTVSMNSGLTAEAISEFTVSWTDMKCLPNAEISYDPETVVTHIRPYCEEYNLVFYQVTLNGSIYTKTDIIVDIEEGVPVETSQMRNVYTKTGEQVFSGTTVNGESVHYCTVEEKSLMTGISLSVYRREFDGSFVELATGLDNTKNTFITDPHPALDYARYRIVAITVETGAVSFYDAPGYPIGEHSIIIQWNEDWSYFDTVNNDELEQPVWSGSMLKLPYNVNVSDSNSPDVSLVKYIGRKHPVSYYGTQLGSTSNWDTQIPKSDKDTLYGLRRLANWMGDVYVREPSGSGYWANIKVSFGQTHKEVTIPVSFSITRVEGGI